jgi:hypothetical protein
VRFSFSVKTFARSGGVGHNTPRRGGRESNDFSNFLLSFESVKSALNERWLTKPRIQTKPFSHRRETHAEAVRRAGSMRNSGDVRSNLSACDVPLQRAYSCALEI